MVVGKGPRTEGAPARSEKWGILPVHRGISRHAERRKTPPRWRRKASDEPVIHAFGISRLGADSGGANAIAVAGKHHRNGGQVARDGREIRQGLLHPDKAGGKDRALGK